MAIVVTRTLASGKTSHQVRWRYAGKAGAKVQSVTYKDPRDAKSMAGAITALRDLVYREDPRVMTFELVTGQKAVTYTAPTFGHVAARYVETRTRAKRTSRDQYAQTVARRLTALVDRPIEAITSDDIRVILNGITDSGQSATSTYELACSIFKFAINSGMLPNGNPASHVQAPKKRGRTANFLTTREAGILRNACLADEVPAVGAALADLLDVILGTGLRISEVLGLIVDDVHVSDVNHAWIDVARQLSQPGVIPMGRVPLKSEASERRVVLDADTARTLARLVAGKRSTDQVFIDPIDGGWWRQWRVNHGWARAVTVAQANDLAKTPRVHDLRHTHAAWLLTDGVSLLAVSRRLGHETIAITADTYGHLLPEGDDVIRLAIAGRLATMANVKPVAVQATPPESPGAMAA